MTNYNTKKKSFEYQNGFSCTTARPKTEVNGEEVTLVTDLPNHESSRCWVLQTANYIYLQSYNTVVSKLTKPMNELVETKHSVTTSKQQSWFAERFIHSSRKVVDNLWEEN